MALIGKPARIMKSTGGIKFSREPKSISQMEGSAPLLENEKEKAVNGSAIIR
jgi:hypothetical protein